MVFVIPIKRTAAYMDPIALNISCCVSLVKTMRKLSNKSKNLNVFLYVLVLFKAKLQLHKHNGNMMTTF